MKTRVISLLMILSLSVCSQSYRPLDTLSFTYSSNDSLLSGYLSGWFPVYGEIDSLRTRIRSSDTLEFNMYYTACDAFQMFYAYDTTFALHRYISSNVDVIRVHAFANDMLCVGSNSVDLVDTAFFHLNPNVSLEDYSNPRCEPYTVNDHLVLPCIAIGSVVEVYDMAGVAKPFIQIDENHLSLAGLPPGVYIVCWISEGGRDSVSRVVR